MHRHCGRSRQLRVTLAFAVAAVGCERSAADTTTAAALPAPAELPVPAGAGSAEPFLHAGPDGAVLLSWIEPMPDSAGHALRLSFLEGDAWTAPRTVAEGDDWFVNWADFPSVHRLADGTLAAHWLQRNGPGTYAYGVRISLSRDGGATWSTPITPHRDSTETEHGFVSLWVAGPERVGVAWLDGRHTAEDTDEAQGSSDAHAGHGGHGDGTAEAGTTPAEGDVRASGGAAQAVALPAPATPMMTLRTAHFDARLQRHDEQPLDLSTCDCCQTSAALTSPALPARARAARRRSAARRPRRAAPNYPPRRPAPRASGRAAPRCTRNDRRRRPRA